MECEVRFFGAVSTATDSVEAARIRFDGTSAEDLLDYIQIKWPGTRDFISGSKSGSVVFLLNEKALKQDELRKELKEGDKLSILPFVVGG